MMLPLPWKGRSDPTGLRWHQVVQLGGAPQAGEFCFLGFPSDEGVARNQGRIGAAEGPASLRMALGNLAVQRASRLRDLGDIPLVEGDLETAQMVYAELGAQVIESGATLVGLGGGHEIAYASYRAVRRAFPGSRIGILNFDAHFDLREEPHPTSGNSFLLALRDSELTSYHAWGISAASNTTDLFGTATRYGATWTLDTDTPGELNALGEWLHDQDHVYVTICLDVLPAHEAPGVSAPAARGVEARLLSQVLREVVRTGRVRALDVAELNPRFDQDNRTARAAARLIWDAVEATVG